MEPQQRPTDEVRVLFLPLPAMGHLLPMVELAKCLLKHHPRFTITVLCIPPLSPYPQISAYISSVASSGLPISFHDLPAVDPPVLDDQSPEIFISVYLELHRPVVKSAIETIMATSPAPVAAVVLDLFCTAMIDVANELGTAPYIFYATGASTLGFMMHLPTLDAAAIPDDKTFEEMEGEALLIPGFSSLVPVHSLPDPMPKLKGEGYKWFIRHGLRYLEAKGIIINSFAELQPYAIVALEEGLYVPDYPTPSVYPVGPILSIEPTEEAEGGGVKHECVRWLDEQPQGSVVFLCFGSLGKFQTDQVREIAAGLERSGHRFLWVLRSPGGQQEQGSYTRPTDAVLDEVLPDGFLERTKSRGMVWPSFAPQREILTHEAVGGFVSHCGWNSTLESLWCGVPMAAWPLYAEQYLNAFELTREVGVAVEVRIDRMGGSAAGADEVERAVRCLMGEEGGEVRKKTKEMKEKAKKAVQEGGSSFLSMKKLAEDMIWGASKEQKGQLFGELRR